MPKPQRILVKLTPKSSVNKIKGWALGPYGERILKIHVTVVPDKGRANEALIKLLAKHLGIPKSAIALVCGATDRLKTIEIQRVTKNLYFHE